MVQVEMLRNMIQVEIDRIEKGCYNGLQRDSAEKEKV